MFELPEQAAGDRLSFAATELSYGEFTERTSFSLNSDNFFVPNNAVTQGFRLAGWRPGDR